MQTFSPIEKRHIKQNSTRELWKLRVQYRLKRIPDLLGLTRKAHAKQQAGKKDALFVWIPKNAGTSLVESIGVIPYLSPFDVSHRFPGCGPVTFGHMNLARLLEEGLVPPDFVDRAVTFSVVRNPYDRAVSLYHYLLDMQDLPPKTSFTDFCEILHARGCEPVELHNVLGFSQCNPQVRWLEGLNIDRLIRFETLAETYPSLCRDLGLEPVQATLAEKNRSTRQSYTTYYTPQAKQLVESFYAEDFQKLEYGFEPFSTE